MQLSLMIDPCYRLPQSLFATYPPIYNLKSHSQMPSPLSKRKKLTMP